jgi:Asp-tRNA(Asn)/Glu-tRNA(Gln) amidotransferase A subunit family amidase
MCGVVALKPTEARISIRHAVGGIPGKGRMALGIGFFTHTVEEHIFLLEQALASNYFHKTAPKTVPLPLRKNLIEETLNKKSLRIGYFVDDGFLKPTPGCARSVIETVAKLEALGHELVRFDIPRPYEAAEYCYKSIMTDGGTYLCKLYSKDIVDTYLSSFVMLINVSF